MITVNVIGAGRWGPNLIRAFHDLAEVRVHVVCDTDESRLALARHRFEGIRTSTTTEDAIADPKADAVVIATPVSTHYELTLAALRAGKHVLVEKPLCGSPIECEELQSLATDRGLVLAVGHVFLFNAGIRKVREYIHSGELGRIFYIHASRTNLGPIRDDVNALWDLASHDLSIFQYWLDAVPTEVTAHGESFLGHQVQDVVIGSYRYPGGVMACVHASWLNPRKVREITIVGSRKMAVWDDMSINEPVRIYNKWVETRRPEAYAEKFGSFPTTIREGDVLIPKVAGPEPVAAECEHFIECIRTGRKPLNHAGLATDVVQALAATDESLRDGGRRVRIPAVTAATSPVEQRREAVGAQGSKARNPDYVPIHTADIR